jgi:hypothetical protein
VSTRNLHWYNINQGIAYPVDDGATCAADDGQRLPPDILVDLNLRWPRGLGWYAFVASVAVTPRLVTVMFQAAVTLDDDDFRPLAVVSVPRPVLEGRVYALQAQAPGVGGWLVFGAGATDRAPYSGRFSSPRQSRLAPRAARPYADPPVRSVSALGSASVLTGVVSLRASPPLELSREERQIEGVVRDCVVVRLVEQSGIEGVARADDANAPSVFREFAGACAGRPESNTCGVPEPIQSVNAVPPDCDGTLTLEFRGCAKVTQIAGGHGAAIDCDLGLADACVPPYLPNSAGLLPTEYSPVFVKTPSDGGVPTASAPSEYSVGADALPHLECFRSGLAPDFQAVEGLWLPAEDRVPYPPCGTSGFSDSRSLTHDEAVSSYAASTAATRNVSVWSGAGQTTFRVAAAEFKMTSGPPGTRHNGGLVLNYGADPVSGLPTYYLAEADYDVQEFRLARFDGTGFREVAHLVLPGITLDTWYRVEVTVRPAATPGSTSLAASLAESADPGAVPATLAATVADYAPSVGRFGLHSNRALTRFGSFSVEAVHA